MPRSLDLGEEKQPPMGAIGLDPVSGAEFSEIVAPHEPETSFYNRNATPGERPSQFTPMVWVMIVIAGMVLGFAVAMLLAGA